MRTIAYAVLSIFVERQRFPRNSEQPEANKGADRCFIMDVDKERLENAPGFDKSNWPDMADTSWGHSVHRYWTGRDDYGVEAARRYDQGAGAIADKEVDQKAREARSAIHGPEGESLRRAEDLGKERIKR